MHQTALENGALGCSISGAGPSVFCLCKNTVEAEKAGLKNDRGTIAMALRGQDADSATDQFFINVADNTNLDNGPPPFTVFGNVVQGLAIVDSIVAVPVATVNVRALQNGTLVTTSFDNVPVTDVTVVRAERE